jgi:hypothetical protein
MKLVKFLMEYMCKNSRARCDRKHGRRMRMVEKFCNSPVHFAIAKKSVILMPGEKISFGKRHG